MGKCERGARGRRQRGVEYRVGGVQMGEEVWAGALAFIL